MSSRLDRPPSTVGVVLALLMVTAACNERQPSSTGRASAVAPAPAFVNGANCEPLSDPELPERAGCLSSVSAGGERLAVYALSDRDERPVTWRIRLESSDGDLDSPLHAGTVAAYPRVAAVSDIDDDGDADWWWVKVLDYASHGAPWGGLHIFVEDATGIVPVMNEGSPLVVNYGGISRLGEGAECRADELVLLRAEARDRANIRWATTERRFSIDGTEATFEGRSTGVIRIEDYNDPKLDPYYEVDCHGSRFTPFGAAS